MSKKIANIDTINILFDIQDYEDEASKVIEYLEQEKEKAKLVQDNNINDKHSINISDIDFQILPIGTNGYAYILRNNGYEIKIAKYRAKLKGFFPIQVRVSAEYLWSFGLTSSYSQIYNWITITFGSIIDEKIIRLDLCCHISDVDLITNNSKVYKGKFKKRQVYYSGNAINALYFGSRKGKNILCRIYNKSLEVKEIRKKLWFIDIWKDNQMNIENVWNIEFQLSSTVLRRFKIDTLKDLYENIQALWLYCTKEWLIKIDRTSKRVDRCKINNDWEDIQTAYNNFKSGNLIEREKQVLSDANALIPAISGYITSYSAKKEKRDIKGALKVMSKDINNATGTFFLA